MLSTGRLNRKGGGRVASGHPWIFSSDVIDRGDAGRGDAVLVVDPSGKTLGTAHYSESSQICLRMLADRAETIDRAFFLRRLTEADPFRRRIVTCTDPYRLVHGQGDQLPG